MPSTDVTSSACHAQAPAPVDVGGVYVITGNEYVSSLALLPDPWTGLAKGSRVLISLPEQGTILYAVGPDPHGSTLCRRRLL